MPQVTEAEVKKLIETSLDVTPFILTASLIVTEDLADSGLSIDRKKQIELYLAAHYTALTEGRGGLKVSKTGDSLESYQGKFGSGLNMTRFGQQAVSLDSSGILANMAESNKKALFRVV